MSEQKPKMTVKKVQYVLGVTLLAGLVALGVILVAAAFADTQNIWGTILSVVRIPICVLAVLWAIAVCWIFINKGTIKRWISRTLFVANILLLSGLVFVSVLYTVAVNGAYNGDFSVSTMLYQNKSVMVIVPHQDDDINLVGGIIEPYIAGGSDVMVVFSTNGDYKGKSELRAEETVNALTGLGVERNKIYYLGFGDMWKPQTIDGQEISHIYHSPDDDIVWTSAFGATATYGTESIDCYLNVPYTRNQFVRSLQELILEKRPEIIFAVDADNHADHKGTSLFFEEAMCNILKAEADYCPVVYKGFCYETAWTSYQDYFSSFNLLSSRVPDSETWERASLHYNWKQRVRFPVDQSNLNPVLSNNTIYRALDAYASQEAVLQAERILNGDKVFWKRRTDSLLYNAQILVGDQSVSKLNDFKLKDFDKVTTQLVDNVGVVPLHGETVCIRTSDAATADCVYLYDNPAQMHNILKGYLVFDSKEKIEFGPLEKDGSATEIHFSEKQFQQMEIVITEFEGDEAGLSEIEAYYGMALSQEQEDTCLMAVDNDDNFVYDYILQDEDSVALRVYNVPQMLPLGYKDIQVHLEQEKGQASYRWEDDTLIVACDQGSRCKITISDETASTTFTVSSPSKADIQWLRTVRSVDRMVYNTCYFFDVAKDWVIRLFA